MPNHILVCRYITRHNDLLTICPQISSFFLEKHWIETKTMFRILFNLFAKIKQTNVRQFPVWGLAVPPCPFSIIQLFPFNPISSDLNACFSSPSLFQPVVNVIKLFLEKILISPTLWNCKKVCSDAWTCQKCENNAAIFQAKQYSKAVDCF